MIGVIANPAEHDVVREFFELFKTPWEFYEGNKQYDVVVCSEGDEPDPSTKLIVVYGAAQIDALATGSQSAQWRFLSYRGSRIPIYGTGKVFSNKIGQLLTEEGSDNCGAYVETIEGISRARIGYDLFSEVRTLLTTGQPSANAAIPALDLHITVLRNLMIECGISFVEIPPTPEGYRFVACLTHDVDHPSIRHHRFDHTIIGFLYRATLGSLIEVFLRRMTLSTAAANFLAALKLPLVYAGLAKDFWSDFDEKYLQLEQGLPSTFFVIARKRYAGKGCDAMSAALRASPYEARDIADTIRRLRAAGREVGLHGIDAWIDSSAGRAELEEIRCLTGVPDTGVRMHWLYFNESSPEALEEAGAAYDSTSGYNETVGYRTGTTQVFKPLGVTRLLELPLHAMDTALFYLSYLGLSPRKASERLRQLTDKCTEYGGCMTVNWHDRSLAPERLWAGCYRELIEDLKSRGAWFATASQATTWFQKRRSVVFEADAVEGTGIRVKFARESIPDLPRLRLRVYKPREQNDSEANGAENYVDTVIEEPRNAHVTVAARYSEVFTPVRPAGC